MGIDTQTLTVIISILVPTISGLFWIIHRMDKQFEKVDARFEKIDARFEKMETRISGIENKLTAIDMRTSFIERLLEMVRLPQLPQKEKKVTDP